MTPTHTGGVGPSVGGVGAEHTPTPPPYLVGGGGGVVQRREN